MFEGWIIKFGEEIFPVQYIAPASYDVTPEQRRIVDDWLDTNGKKHYNIFSNRKAKVDLKTKIGLKQKEIEDIQRIIKAGLLEETEGKYDVTIWNPDQSEYKKIEARMADIRYKMRKVDPDKKDIVYDSFEISLEEY